MPRRVPPDSRQLSLIDRRLIEAAPATYELPDEILYQHSIMCQVGLPYRDPGDAREWERTNGRVTLFIDAGRVKDLDGNTVRLGLPYGPKPRLILAHLNAEALRTKSPQIEVEGSLTAFIKRLKLDANGYTIKGVKNQLARLAAARLSWSVVGDHEVSVVKDDIIKHFNIFFQKDARQRVMWPSTVTLDPTYFESLQRHAVPLHPEALHALSHSSLALDIYAWLAQRLYRIAAGKPQLVSWPALQAQFGPDRSRDRRFRQVFKIALAQVRAVYPNACLDVTEDGLLLKQSHPPVLSRRSFLIA